MQFKKEEQALLDKIGYGLFCVLCYSILGMCIAFILKLMVKIILYF